MTDELSDNSAQEQLQHEKNMLVRLFERLLPLIDGVSDTVRLIALAEITLVAWVFSWMVYFNSYSIYLSVLTTVVISVPIVLVLYTWRGLEELKRLPETIADTFTGAKHEIQEKVRNIRSSDKQKMSLMGAAKSVLKIGSMVAEARDLIGSYVQITSLLNPLLLFLSFLSILFIIPLFFVSMGLVVMTIWPWQS